MFLPLLLSLLLCSSSWADKPLNCSDVGQYRHTLRAGEKMLGDKFDDFDWDLSKNLNAAEKGNMVISPISLKVVLAMLFEGAKGQTAHEIGAALDLNNATEEVRMNTRERFSTILRSLQTHKGKYEIKIGTHVFYDKHAKPSDKYQCQIHQYYNSAMKAVDFNDTKEAVKIINNWGKNVTEGHIQQLISEAEDHSSTIMLLLNAVYFKGLWEIPFPENQTEPGTFYLNEKENVTIQMMNTTAKFGYINITDLDAQLIRLPYLGGKFAMYILMPNSKTGLDKLGAALGPDRHFTDYIKNVSMNTINFIMPKFDFTFTVNLRKTLEDLGIKKMFSSEADLSDIGTGNLVVSSVLQKARISVTEIGTVASAATTVDLTDKFGGEEEVFEFRADRPFFFFIQDESVKTTVFVGKVSNPQKAQVIASPCTGKPSECADGQTDDLHNKFGNDDSSEEDSNEDHHLNDTKYGQIRFNFFDAILLKELGMKEGGNFLVSPASVKSLLALIVEGAEGTTLSELLTTMRLPANMTKARPLLDSMQAALQDTMNSVVTVDSISKVFVSKRFKANDTYEKAIKKHYNAEVKSQDFSSPRIAANLINSWVSAMTEGLITSLIDEEDVNPDTAAILASAIFFSGKWKTAFNPQDTKEQCFFSKPGVCEKTRMMATLEEFDYKLDRVLDCHVLQIPYEDVRFSMVIVMPRKEDGMKQLTIDADKLTFPRLIKDMRDYEVNLTMPSFTMEYGAELTNTLRHMDLNEVFSDTAKLPYMISNTPGKVDTVVHKAKIEVTETGTKAAASSGASVVPLMYTDQIELAINHPFYFFIYDKKTNTVLFSGRLSTVGKPQSTLLGSAPDPSSVLNTKLENQRYTPTSTPRYTTYEHSKIHFPHNATDKPYSKEYIQYMEQQSKG